MLVHWIWLAIRTGVSDHQKKLLLEAFSDAESIYHGEEYPGTLSPEAAAALADKSLDEAQRILETCLKKDIRICTYAQEEYPARLKNIADPPAVLYYKGVLPDVSKVPVIGVVGTRRASGYGLAVAADMGYQIAKCGAVVVSGLADGIDSMAMQGALLADAPVIGVLGCGADVVYPVKNRKLYADTQAHGCLLTEFAPGEQPVGWHFPKRNRIISGLSNGVLVVEAPERSGALKTASHAAEQGRDVFVVPGNIGVDTCLGSNALLREGAISVSSGWDVVSEYGFLYPDTVRRAAADPVSGKLPPMEEAAGQKRAKKPEKSVPSRDGDRKSENKPIDKGENRGYSDRRKPLPALSPEESRILSALEGTCLVDDLIALLGLPAGKVLSSLTMLQIKGLVRQLPGNRVVRSE